MIDWPYRDILSQAVLQLQEQGVLTKMKTKWWKEKRGGGACSQGGDSDGAEELGIANLGGVYLVLFIGSMFASFYGFLEWLLSIYTTARRNKVSFKSELMDEMRFIMKCSGNTKAVKYPKTSGSSSSKRSSATVYSIPMENLDENKSHAVSDTN